MSRRPKKTLIISIITVVVLAAAAWFVYSLFTRTPPKDSVIDKVAALYSVSEEAKKSAEAVQIGTISETDRKTNTVYRDAQTGDWIVTFKSIGKAVIYRESTNQLIRVDNIVTAPATSSSGQK